MNPNICTKCESQFTKVWKTKQIVRPATILFADIRGYTTLSQLTDSQEVASLLSGFYDRCAQVIWERDGIVNKLIGDAILAVFNFPITREDHVEQAVYAGLELQRRCMEMKSMSGKLATGKVDFGVGVGVHTGDVSVGEIGEFCKDFTVIGEVVNLGSRLQGVAKSGEVVLSEAVYEKVKNAFPGIPAQAFDLKGIDRPVTAYVLASDQGEASRRQNG
jgi:class 3 adenylate cyclase